jgi:hypothetical protein
MAVDLVQDLAQNAETADARDKQRSCRPRVNADCWARTDPVARSLGADDLVIGNLDADLVAPLAAVQPQPIRVELEPAVEGNPTVPPKHRVTRHRTDLGADGPARHPEKPAQSAPPFPAGLVSIAVQPRNRGSGGRFLVLDVVVFEEQDDESRLGGSATGRGGVGQSARGYVRPDVSPRLMLRLEEQPDFAVDREAAEWLAARLPAGSDTRRQIQALLENPLDESYLGSVQIISELDLVRGVISAAAAVGDAVPDDLIRLAGRAD